MFRRAFPFALASFLALSAQDHPPTPTSAVQEHTTAPAAKESQAPGRQASHASEPQESREHRPQEHKNQAHGPAIKLFGFPLGPFGQFAVKSFNFLVFFLILFFMLKKALSSAFQARTQELTDQLAQAEREKAEGEKQIQALDSRMAGLEKELEAARVKAEQESELEKQKILEAARQEAHQILEQTKQEIAAQRRMAEHSLRVLVAQLAIEGATERLKRQVQGTVADEVLERAILQIGSAK